MLSNLVQQRARRERLEVTPNVFRARLTSAAPCGARGIARRPIKDPLLVLISDTSMHTQSIFRQEDFSGRIV